VKSQKTRSPADGLAMLKNSNQCNNAAPACDCVDTEDGIGQLVKTKSARCNREPTPFFKPFGQGLTNATRYTMALKRAEDWKLSCATILIRIESCTANAATTRIIFV
jgi:hypothetical protein